MDKNEYLLKEAEYLRGAILTLIDKIEALERYALLSTGAIWSWAAANSQQPSINLLLWSPLIIQSLFAFRALVKWKQLKLYIEYLAKVENKIELESAIGIGTLIQRKWEKLAERTGAMFWMVLVLITIFVNWSITVFSMKN